MFVVFQGGGAGGTIRDAGGSFGKMEAAHEEEYFRRLVRFLHRKSTLILDDCVGNGLRNIELYCMEKILLLTDKTEKKSFWF